MMYDLEGLRDIFKDTRLHIGVGTIVKLGLANDGSKLRVMVNLLPENRQVVAQMTFSDVMDVEFPEIDDLAIVAFIDGHPDECYVLRLVNNKDEPIPKFAQQGDKVVYSRAGMKNYIGSDTKVGIGRPNIEPSEPLVLGTQLQTLLENVLTQLAQLSGDLNTLAGQVNDLATEVQTISTNVSTHTHPTAAPGPPSPPLTAALFVTSATQAGLTGSQALETGNDASEIQNQLDEYKSSPVQNGDILSEIAFTEKGAE
jgi:hypothetical protein